MVLTQRLVEMKRSLKHSKLTAGLLFSGLLAGCSSMFNPVGDSNFSCPGMPQGITCKTPAAVYKSTNGQLPEVESDLPMGSAGSERGSNLVQQSQLPGIKVNNVRTAAEIANSPSPVRAPAQIMRVWIAPWVDKNDNLNYPGVIYTEITPRKWVVGMSEAVGGGMVTPYQVPAQSAQGGGQRFNQNQQLPLAADGISQNSGYASTPISNQDLNSGFGGVVGAGYQTSPANGVSLPNVEGMRMQ
jgi:conjugal transfer pilus assembly protein TraV